MRGTLCQLLGMELDVVYFWYVWQPVAQEHCTDRGKTGFDEVAANSGCRCHTVS